MGNKPTLGGIPGNIKQYMLPFQLKPDSGINQSYDSSDKVQGPPQYFTFKNKSYNTYKNQAGGCGQLRIFPSSLNEEIMTNDIIDDVSYKVLYDSDVVNGIIAKDRKDKVGISLTNLTDNIQSVTIREYLPDTMLEQCINFFINLFNSFMDLFRGAFNTSTPKNETSAEQKSPDAKSAETKTKTQTDSSDNNGQEATETKNVSFGGRLLETVYYFMQQLLGVTKSDPEASSMWGGFVNGAKINMLTSEYPQRDGDDYDAVVKIIKMPYILYYRLQSTVTTNIYELPFLDESKLINKSNGTIGWQATGLAITSFFKMQIDIINKLIGNIKTNYMPFWDPTKTDNGEGEEVKIKFNLFNDTAEAALINFIFVNTIIPNNRLIQYGIIQHAPCLYDVRVEGGNRLLCCAGEFEVGYSGIMRTPPKSFIKTLCSKHASVALKGVIEKAPESDENSQNKENPYAKGDALAEMFFNNQTIKIPDVYIVTMNFKSLLPMNFNTFLYQYAGNNRIENTRILSSSSAYENNSGIPNAMVNAISTLVKNVISVAKNGYEWE